MHRNGDDTSIPARAGSFVLAVIKRRRDICLPLGMCVGIAIAACECEGFAPLRLSLSAFAIQTIHRFIPFRGHSPAGDDESGLMFA